MEDHYDLDEVIDRMTGKRDRKIPGSVYKMHAPVLTLMQSASLGQPKPLPRVFFTYPKYCFVKENQAQDALNLEQTQQSTSADMKQGESFMQVVDWHKGAHLREFQSC